MVLLVELLELVFVPVSLVAVFVVDECADCVITNGCDDDVGAAVGAAALLPGTTVSSTTKSMAWSNERPIWNMSFFSSASYCTITDWLRDNAYVTE